MKLIIPCALVQHDDHRVTCEFRRDDGFKQSYLESIYPSFISNMAAFEHEHILEGSLNLFMSDPSWKPYYEERVKKTDRFNSYIGPTKSVCMDIYRQDLMLMYIERMDPNTRSDILSIVTDFVNEDYSSPEELGYRLDTVYGDEGRSHGISSVILLLPETEGSLEIGLLPDLETVEF